jgi:hypothetical protein
VTEPEPELGLKPTISRPRTLSRLRGLGVVMVCLGIAVGAVAAAGHAGPQVAAPVGIGTDSAGIQNAGDARADDENAGFETLYLSGKIGTAPVLLSLDKAEGVFSGWYLSPRDGRQALIEGKLAPGGAFTLHGHASGGEASQTIEASGTAAGGRWTGTWRTARGPALSLALEESRETLADLTLGLTCGDTEVDRRYGYTYKTALTLDVKQGAVRRLRIDQSVIDRKSGDEGGCAIGLDDLEPAPDTGTGTGTRAGLLLQTRGSGAEGASRCTVRLVGVGDYLLVRVGDPTEEGNDCRADDAASYCTSRALWRDTLVNRRTRRCGAVK